MCQGEKFITLYQKGRICVELKAEPFPAPSSGGKIIQVLEKERLTQSTPVVRC